MFSIHLKAVMLSADWTYLITFDLGKQLMTWSARQLHRLLQLIDILAS